MIASCQPTQTQRAPLPFNADPQLSVPHQVSVDERVSGSIALKSFGPLSIGRRDLIVDEKSGRFCLTIEL
jgi:hypothetical protein